jgi:hypothetical protein
MSYLHVHKHHRFKQHFCEVGHQFRFSPELPRVRGLVFLDCNRSTTPFSYEDGFASTCRSVLKKEVSLFSKPNQMALGRFEQLICVQEDIRKACTCASHSACWLELQIGQTPFCDAIATLISEEGCEQISIRHNSNCKTPTSLFVDCSSRIQVAHFLDDWIDVVHVGSPKSGFR